MRVRVAAYISDVAAPIDTPHSPIVDTLRVSSNGVREPTDRQTNREREQVRFYNDVDYLQIGDHYIDILLFVVS